MPQAVANLLNLLDLEPIEKDIFRGHSPRKVGSASLAVW